MNVFVTVDPDVNVNLTNSCIMLKNDQTLITATATATATATTTTTHTMNLVF